jgi:hypothetical protein
MPDPVGSGAASYRRLALIAIAIGAILSIALYLQRPSLWLDEAGVALNIGRRSFAGLAEPLDWRQFAPVPWLWLEKLAVTVGGMHEWALRAPALVAGIALPWLVWAAGRRLVGEPAALVATVLTASGASLRYYANETKPYALDAAVAALLLLLAARMSDHRDDHRSWWGIGIIGVLAILMSFPAVLILGGIGLALASDALVRRHWPSLRRAVGWGIVWVAAFAVPQFLLYRRAASIARMPDFWRPAMAQIGTSGLIGRVSAAVNELIMTLMAVTVWPGSRLFLALFAVGAWIVWRRGGARPALLLIGPLFVTGVAWGIDRLPAHRRLMLFLAPVIALLLGAALTGMVDSLPRRWRSAGVALCLLLVLGVVISEISTGVRERKPSGGRELAAAVLARDPAPLWLTGASAAVWLVYSTDWSRPDTVRLDWFAATLRPRGPINRGGPDAAARTPDELLTFSAGPRGLEMLATPSGLHIDVAGAAAEGPSHGWGAHEAARIVAVAGRGAWLLMTHDRESERDALLAALRAFRIPIDAIRREQRGSLWWVIDPPASAARP